MSLPRRELAHEVRHVHDANPRRIDACILQGRLPDLGHEGLERRALAHDDAREVTLRAAGDEHAAHGRAGSFQPGTQSA